jgi:NADH-quinone oxidoreductase subunit I
MIVKRNKLTFWERLYLPAILGGLRVTIPHFVRTLFGGHTAAKETAGGYYPEVPWTVQPDYRGAPYLVRDQDGAAKCVSCQLCEFVCPPKAIRITPPGPDGPPADRPNAEKMPLEFEIDMLRCIFCGFCQEVCPEEAIFLQKDYSLTGHTRQEMLYDMEKLLALGGVRGGIRKWKRAAEEAKEQETFPVKG